MSLAELTIKEKRTEDKEPSFISINIKSAKRDKGYTVYPEGSSLVMIHEDSTQSMKIRSEDERENKSLVYLLMTNKDLADEFYDNFSGQNVTLDEVKFSGKISGLESYLNKVTNIAILLVDYRYNTLKVMNNYR